MVALEDIDDPQDLLRLSAPELADLAGQIRRFLVQNVSRTGGHLGPNLGVVELTMAVHRVFDSPRDTVVFDTGHQAYVQAADQPARLRPAPAGNLNIPPGGVPARCGAGSPPRAVRADGSPGRQLFRVKPARVAVVGDGALTGGMCWEALNNIAATSNPLVIVVNDNGRSYAPTIGGLAHHLSTLRTHAATSGSWTGASRPCSAAAAGGWPTTPCTG
jgi:1-deoxy-D-xylulose-5-phosphate synthase